MSRTVLAQKAAGSHAAGDAIRFLEDDRRYAASVIALSAAVLIVTVFADKWGDIDNYYVHAERFLDGSMPYSGFDFEYPPLAIVFMAVPALVSWDLESYRFASAAMAYVALLIVARVLDRFSDDMVGTRWQSRLLVLLTVGFCSYFLIARNDIYATAMAVVAIRLFQTDRPVAASAVAATAAMVKFYPAILVLPMLCILIERRDLRSACLSLASAALVCLLVEAPFLIADPDTAFAYLTYHSDRGIQVESVAAGLLLVYGELFPGEIAVVSNYGSHNLSGAIPDAVAPCMNVVLIAVLLAFTAAMAVRMHGSGTDVRRQSALLGAICAAMVLLFICFSKVYSAQYLVWIMLLLPFTQASCFDPGDRRRVLTVLGPFGVFSMLSYVAYACLDIHEPDDLIVLMVFMKNLFHILLMIAVMRLCWNAAGRPEGADGPAVSRGSAA